VHAFDVIFLVWPRPWPHAITASLTPLPTLVFNVCTDRTANSVVQRRW